jgi:hypothetical protein
MQLKYILLDAKAKSRAKFIIDAIRIPPMCQQTNKQTNKGKNKRRSGTIFKN